MAKHLAIMENKCSLGPFVTLLKLLKQDIDNQIVEFKCGIARQF